MWTLVFVGSQLHAFIDRGSQSFNPLIVPFPLHDNHQRNGFLQEFLCAINGHVMKEPVKARTSGLVFEHSTIELWLSTRGSVCPITNTVLEKSDLVPDDELRNRCVGLCFVWL